MPYRHKACGGYVQVDPKTEKLVCRGCGAEALRLEQIEAYKVAVIGQAPMAVAAKVEHDA